jgi:zinc transport system substrate-binding protein
MRLVPVLLVATLILSGCSALGIGSGREGSHARPQVVASFYPLAYVAERVGGAHVDVEDLTHPGVEPHDLELTVQQTFDVADADLVFYERGLQAAVDDAVDQTAPAHVVDAAQASPPVGDNPHIWVDPLRLDAVARAFRDGLVRTDPAHASSYRSGYERLDRDLRALDRSYRLGLAQCRVKTAVVSHDAFGYWQRYGLHFAFINGLSPDAEPSPAHVRELQDLIRKDNITTVFSETLASPTSVLDPIEGLSDATAGEDYLSLMRSDLANLEKAQECS